VEARVARWFYFQTKNPNLGKFRMALDWKKWVYFWPFGHILRTSGIFYICMTILCLRGIFFQFWYHGPEKNLATLAEASSSSLCYPAQILSIKKQAHRIAFTSTMTCLLGVDANLLLKTRQV
jgi:hypothetical protein